MRFILKFFSLLSIVIVTVSCANEEVMSHSKSNNLGDIVFQKRAQGTPKVITKDVSLGIKRTRGFGENGEIIGNSDALLGYSYTIGSSIMGDYNNVISPVIDVNKVKALNENYVTPKQLTTARIDAFSYTDFQRYVDYSSVTKKTTSGFHIQIGPFSFGRKKKTKEIFTSYEEDSTKSVYGELGLYMPNNSFSLLSTESLRKRFSSECLSSVFMDNIYNSTIGNVIDNYGEFVLTGYITGGKAFGLYYGKDEEHQAIEKREKDMNTIMNMSFSWTGKNKADSGKVGLDTLLFGKQNTSFNSTFSFTQNTYVHLELFGGKMEGNVSVGTTKLTDLNIDLTAWRTSLNDSKLHTIIDVLDGGLYPLSAFLLERNFRERYEDTQKGIVGKRTKLVTPKIEIARYYVRSTASGKPLYDVAAVLYTRQGDRIVLSKGKGLSVSDYELQRNDNEDVFISKAKAIYDSIKDKFDLDIRTQKTKRYNSTMRNENERCIVLDFSFENMYKYVNPKSGIEYIYYQNPNNSMNKYAFSFYTDDWNGDVVVDYYLMRKWTDTLHEKNISMALLANTYTIIGL